jgi:Ca-activated chloride channel family protein
VSPISGEMVQQSVEISSPLGAWETPEDGYFSGESVAKGFVMLNIYVGFEMAASRAEVGDDAGALSILVPLMGAVEEWLVTNADADIEDDLIYLELFIENLNARTVVPSSPRPAPEPWPND